MRLFGFEASPGTYRALAAAPAWAAAQGVIRIENLAGDAAPGTLMFPNSCGTASEICAPDATKGAGDATAVPATSVDAWRATNDVGRIFWLAIDTEGNDPAVLRGAEATLAEGEVVVVQVRTLEIDFLVSADSCAPDLFSLNTMESVACGRIRT